MRPERSMSMQNDEWISDAETPDPAKWPFVPGWKIMVRPLPIRTKTKGGIVLPDSVRDDLAYLTTVGRVVALGSDAYTDKTRYSVPHCKVGDIVCYGKYAGAKMYYKGIKVLLLEEDGVLCVIDDPYDVDPMYNLKG